MSPTSISNQAPARVSGTWLPGQPAKVDGSTLPKQLLQIARQREAASKTTSEVAGTFKSARKADNTSSGKVWEQKHRAAGSVKDARVKQTELLSALRSAGIATAEHVSINPMQTIRRQKAESGSEPVVPKKEGGTTSQATAKAPREKVTAAQIFKLGAVAATFPLRVAFGAMYLPVIALSQAGMSIARAITGDKSKVASQWKTSVPDTPDIKGFDQNSMILKSDENDDRIMDRQVAVVAHAHKIDPGRIAVLSEADSPEDQIPKPKEGPLGNLTLNSRLDIVSSDFMVRNQARSPEEIAKILRAKGLQEVGVINVDHLLAGSKTSLVELGNALHKAGVKFGWIASSHGMVTDTRKVGKLGNKTYTWSKIALPWKRMTTRLTPASLDRSIVQGNAPVNFAKTPYHATKPTIASKYFQA